MVCFSSFVALFFSFWPYFSGGYEAFCRCLLACCAFPFSPSSPPRKTVGNGGFVFSLCVCGGFLPHGKPWGTVALCFSLCVCGGFLPHGKPWGTVALCFRSVFVAVSCPTENRGERWLCCLLALCVWWFPAPRKTVGNGGSCLWLTA